VKVKKLIVSLFVLVLLVGCSSAGQSAFNNIQVTWNAPKVKTTTGVELLDLGLMPDDDIPGKCHLYVLVSGNTTHAIGKCSNGISLTSSSDTIEHTSSSSSSSSHHH